MWQKLGNTFAETLLKQYWGKVLNVRNLQLCKTLLILMDYNIYNNTPPLSPWNQLSHCGVAENNEWIYLGYKII